MSHSVAYLIAGLDPEGGGGGTGAVSAPVRPLVAFFLTI